MIEKLKSYYAINMDVLEHRDRIFINNPVIMQGLGLAPIVAVGSSLRSACIIGLAVALMLTPTRMVASLFGRSTHFRFRVVAYAVTSALTYALAAWLIIGVLDLPVQSMGLYLPLLVMEPLIIKRFARSGTERVGTAAKKGLVTTAGFLLVLFPVAAVREVLGAGTFFGLPVFAAAPVPFFGLIGGGFILMGVLIALWRSLVKRFKREARRQ